MTKTVILKTIHEIVGRKFNCKTLHLLKCSKNMIKTTIPKYIIAENEFKLKSKHGIRSKVPIRETVIIFPI